MDQKSQKRREGESVRDQRPEDTTTQDDLDEALSESFPASDPPAPVTKGTTRNPNPRERKEREEREDKWEEQEGAALN